MSDYSARQGARNACGRLVFVVLLQLITFGVDVRGQSACPDEYTYTFQPPTEIVCNPYLNARLMLDCAVTGSEDMNIQWYFSQTTIDSFAEDTVRIENSIKYSVTQRQMSDGVGVSLIVNDLNEDNDTGMYWCQATVGPENTLLTQSEAFTLYGADFYRFIPFQCPAEMFLRNSDTRCAAVVIIEPEVSTMPPSLTPTPTPSTTFLSSPTTTSTMESSSTFSSPMATPTATLTSRPSSTNVSPVGPTIAVDPGLPGMDEPVVGGNMIIYSILAVVGFLLVICALLGCVIFFLCRKRRQKVDLEGYEKDNGAQSFDQDSAQSIVFRSGVRFKGRNGPNLSLAISSSSRSPHDSGDYAEIGPALQSALRSNHTHYYSEIPELPFPRSRNDRPDGQSRDENPYDEPSLPPGFQARDVDQSIEEGVTQEANVADQNTENSTLQGYQILERFPNHSQVQHTAAPPTSSPPPPTSSPPPPPTSDNIEAGFTSPPVSPHSYHILEESLYSPEMGGVVGEDYLYPTITDCSTTRLSTIPEHPYHVLEGNSSSPFLLRLSSDDTDAIELDIKEATPDFVDLEVGEAVTSTSTTTSRDTGFEDREYDRLVDPRQLYHILERSSPGNRPRICGLPDGYDRLDNGIKGRKGAHFLSPQTEDTTISSLSGTSGVSSEDGSCPDRNSRMFDDPQYIYSPKRKAQRSRSKDDEVLHPHQGRSVAYSVEDIDLTKYCGNYERDPCYMARIRRMSAAQNRAKAAEDCTDYASYSPLSRFGTLSSGSSLPDIAHVYQSLEADTRDPLQPYEKLRRTFVGNETETKGL